MRNPFKRKPEQKALTTGSGVIEALHQGWSPFPMLGGGSNDRIIEAFNVAQGASYSWMYRNSPAVRTVVDVITRNVGQLDLRLYEELSEAQREPRPDHDAALSLRYPNEHATSDGLIRSLFCDFLIHDNAYALLTPDTNQQLIIERIPAYMVQVQGSSLFAAENYRIWPQGAWNSGQWAGSGTPVDIAPARVLHWHGENPLDSRVGLSRLDTLRDVVAEDAALAQAIVELANNGLQAPIWVSRPLDAPEMTPTTARSHEEDIANRLRNRNRIPPVMMEGEQLQSFGVSPQDAQMLEIRKWAVYRVAALYGVPPAQVGLEPATPDTTSQFYQDTLPPYCESFTRMLDQRILVRVYGLPAYTFEFNLDEKTGWAQFPNLIAGVGAPLMTRNEGRAKIDLPPKPGGDDLITPLNTTTGRNPLPGVGVMPIQDPNRPPQDGSYRTDQGPTPLPAAGKAAETEEKTAEVDEKAYQSRRTRAKGRQDRNVARLEKTVGNYFKSIEPKLKATVPQTKAGSRKATQNWEQWTSGLTNALARAIRDVIGSEGKISAQQFAGSFDMGKTADYRKAMAEGSAQQMLATLRQEIDEHGLDWAIGRLPQHAASAGGSLGVRSTIFARQEAARQSPNPELRQETWVPDTERHAALDGKSVPLGGVWDGGLRPGSSPGCRCTAIIS